MVSNTVSFFILHFFPSFVSSSFIFLIFHLPSSVFTSHLFFPFPIHIPWCVFHPSFPPLYVLFLLSSVLFFIPFLLYFPYLCSPLILTSPLFSFSYCFSSLLLSTHPHLSSVLFFILFLLPSTLLSASPLLCSPHLSFSSLGGYNESHGHGGEFDFGEVFIHQVKKYHILSIYTSILFFVIFVLYFSSDSPHFFVSPFLSITFHLHHFFSSLNFRLFRPCFYLSSVVLSYLSLVLLIISIARFSLCLLSPIRIMHFSILCLLFWFHLPCTSFDIQSHM